MASRATSPLSHRRLPTRVPSNLNPSTHRSPSPPLSSPSPLVSTLPPLQLPKRAPLSRESSTRESNYDHDQAQDDDDAVSRDAERDAEEDVHPLQAEIERLTALCEKHEQRYRTSKTSFERRVFSEFPDALGRVGTIDKNAENATADLYSSINASVPRLAARLAKLLEERSADVDTMRERTTPWLDFLDDKGHEMRLTRVNSGLKTGRIPKISRLGSDKDGGEKEAQAMAMIEQWADEAERSLADEIARLKVVLGDESRKWSIVNRLVRVVVFGCCLVGFVFALFALKTYLFSYFSVFV